MALTPVPSINLESLPREAISLIETLAGRAQEADRLEQESPLKGNDSDHEAREVWSQEREVKR